MARSAPAVIASCMPEKREFKVVLYYGTVKALFKAFPYLPEQLELFIEVICDLFRLNRRT